MKYIEYSMINKQKVSLNNFIFLDMEYSDIDKNEEIDLEKEKEKEKNSEMIKELIDKNDFGFTRIKTFEQLKAKVLEIKRSHEKTKVEVVDNTGNINIISNKLDDLMEEGEEEIGKNPTTSEGSKNKIKNQISDMNKKLKFLMGGITLEDIEKQNENEEEEDQDNKKIMNFQQVSRKLTQLQFTKVDNVELDSKNEKMNNKIDDIDRKMSELIFCLYGDYDLHLSDDQNHKRITFVTKEEFDEYKTNTEDEFGKIWEEIDKLKRESEIIFDHLKDKGSLKDLDDLKNYLLQKVEEIISGLNKRFVERNENAYAFKNLEDQFKKVIVLLATKAEHENDNWLIAKKPINGFSCAACESYIGDLKEEQNKKYIHWNKMPIREREKEQEKEKEKIYRLGNGYSKVLKMVGVDNNGNVTLNPTSSIEVNSIFSGNNENNKSKEGLELQIHKATYQERAQSAKEKEKDKDKDKEKTIDTNRTKNYYDRRLPKIKGSMSTDNLDKIIENPNPNLNVANITGNLNILSPKITKIMKKTQGKFNI